MELRERDLNRMLTEQRQRVADYMLLNDVNLQKAGELLTENGRLKEKGQELGSTIKRITGIDAQASRHSGVVPQGLPCRACPHHCSGGSGNFFSLPSK